MSGGNVTRWVLVSCLLLPAVARAQTGGGGSIAGVVRDATGAVLPGVTIEAASPALIEKLRTSVTDDQGQYKIVDLRPGTYTVTFTLTGFIPVKREGLELTTAFTATINAELRVGGVEETITVSGQAPIVDAHNVLQQKTLSRDTLDTIPTGKSTTSYAALIPGATMANATAQDVGGTQSESGGSFSIHGGHSADININQDGMTFNSLLAAGNTTFSFNRASMQEVVVQTSGISAETAYGGVLVNVVPKEGGNAFSGFFGASYTDHNLQGANLTDALRARGLTGTSSAKRLYDLGLSLGGPILKDKLWFFTAHRWWGSSLYQGGNYFNATQSSWVYTPDLSRPAFTDDYYRDNTVRVTWQASRKNKVNLSYTLQGNCNCYNGLLTGNAAPEAIGQHLYDPNWAVQGSWTYPATSRLLFEAGATVAILTINSNRQAGVSPDDISVLDQGTNYRYRSRALNLGPAGSYGEHITNQGNERFSVSYVTGSHAFKTGLFMQQGWKNHAVTQINGGMDFNIRNGAPASVRLWELPYTEQERLTNVGLYAQDQWTVRHWTFNLGLRFDSLNGSVPAQSLPAGPLVPARDFPAVSGIPSWKDINPRLGAVYDLFGDGKTAIKVFLGRYVALESLNGFVSLNAPINLTVTSATRTWTDSNRNFVPDCNLTAPAANLECGPLSDALFGQTKITTTYAADVTKGLSNRNYSWQASASVQHELRPGVALNVGYFRTWYGNFTVTYNQAVNGGNFDPYCITAPSDSRLPGGGGGQLCGLFDVTPTLFGRVSNLVTQASNYGKQSEVYNGIDVTINARFARRGLLSGGLSTGRTETNNCSVVVGAPQITFTNAASGFPAPRLTPYCDVVNPWSAQTQVKLLGVVPLPWNLQASATFQNLPGIPITASYVATNAQIAPSLHRNLSAGPAANVTVDLIPPYTQFEDRFSQIDLRMTKILNIRRGKLQANFDIYNILNANPILSEGTRYTVPGAVVAGAAWLQPTQILPGRLFKFGFQINY